MLPSSHRRKKNDPDDSEVAALGDIDRYYKKTNKPIDVTDSRDKSKIKKKYPKKILADSTDDADTYDDLHDLAPSYIESTISDKLSLYHADEEEDYESKFDNGLSIKKHKMTNIRYPFSDTYSEHLVRDLDEIYENLEESGDSTDGGEFVVEYLVYHINKNSYKPFLEFLLYKSSEDETLYLPNFSQSTTDYDILENASLLLGNLFGDGLCDFKGRIVESSVMNSVNSAQLNDRIILLYELTEKTDTVARQKSSDDLWWGTVSEIFNYRKILFYNISETVTDMFLAYPQAIKLYHKETLIETPMVIYNGSNSNTAKYNAAFSIKKSNNESRYGPFYYFTDLHNAMRYTCYDIETGEKNSKGGLVRFIIYPGKMKMFLKKNKPDNSEMAKYICSKHLKEKNTLQFRDNDSKWTEQYNSAYNGTYEIPIRKSAGLSDNGDDDDDDSDDVYKHMYSNGSDRDDLEDEETKERDVNIQSLNEENRGKGKGKDIYYLAMRICISEYNFQMPLSFYYIDTKDIPNNYEYDFKNYKII
jgi:hypothetical protein